MSQTSDTAPPPGAAADVDVTLDLVRELVAAQSPVQGVVRPFTHGWDNAIFHLGDEHLVRAPRRSMGAETFQREVDWMGVASAGLPVAVPELVFVGEPAAGYPYRWGVTRFLTGTTSAEPLRDGEGLRDVLAALHRPASEGAPTTSSRSSLVRRDPDVRDRARLTGMEELLTVWEDALEAPPWTDAPVWVHGDLHPFNVLQRDARLVGVLDWGDLFAGDPAADLASAWMLLEPHQYGPVRDLVDEATWVRGRGWAAYFAIMLTHATAQGAGQGFKRVAEDLVRRLRGA